MKNLNFLSKSSSRSCGHRVTTLALTVGSPSAHRRGIMLKLISVLVLILTLGVGQMWGADQTITLTQSALGLTGSYTTNTTKTVSNVDFTFTDLMKNNSNIQAKASSGVISNSKLIPGKIKSVAITHSGTARPTTIFMGTSSSSIGTQVATGSGSITGNAPTNTCPGYFKITRGSNAAYWTQVVITYTPATITLSNTSITGLDYNVGSGPSASKTFTISGSNIPANLTVTAPTNFEVSLDGSSWASSKTINVTLTGSASAGTLSSKTVYVRLASGNSAGNYSGNVSIAMAGCNTITDINPKTVAVSGTVSAAATPSLTATPTALNWGSVVKGTPLETKTFSISGNYLTAGNLSISASEGWSVDPTSKSVEGTLSSTIITVTPPTTSTAGIKNGTITISGGGLASNVIVDCNLTVQETYTCTWHAASGIQHTQTAVSGAALTDPGTPSAAAYCPGGKVFVGWTATEIDDETDTEPLDLFTSVSGLTMPSSDKHYFAVFAKETEETTPATLTLNSTTLSTPMGASYASTDFTYSGLTFGRSNAAIMSSSIQIKAGTSNAVWNKTALSGPITSIAITYKTNNSTLTVGTSAKPSTNSQSVTATNTYNYSASDNLTHFMIAATSSYTQVASVVVTYNTTNKAHSNYATSCCTPLGSINGSILRYHFFDHFGPFGTNQQISVYFS